jgi:hypothetical protein
LTLADVEAMSDAECGLDRDADVSRRDTDKVTDRERQATRM